MNEFIYSTRSEAQLMDKRGTLSRRDGNILWDRHKHLPFPMETHSHARIIRDNEILIFRTTPVRVFATRPRTVLNWFVIEAPICTILCRIYCDRLLNQFNRDFFGVLGLINE